MTQPSLFPAPAHERDRGMARATAHAEADHDGWGAQAYDWLVAYAQMGHSFLAHEAIVASRGCVPVASGKAWGSVFVRAARDGVLEKVGYAPDPHRHLNPAPVWRRK